MDKKPKIAILIDQLSSGGVQKTAVEETKYLAKFGFKTKLIVLSKKGYQKTDETKNLNVEFLEDNFPKFMRKSFKIPGFHFLSTYHLLFPLLAPLYFQKHNLDLVLSHGTTTTITAYSLSKFQNIPYIMLIHDPMLYILEKIYKNTSLKYLLPAIKVIAKPTEKLIYKKARICILDSSVHKEYLENLYQVKSQILQLAVSPQKTTKIGDEILTFGRWDKGKNLEKLLYVLKELRNSKLIIAGTWTNKNDLKDFKSNIRRLNLEKRVRLITSYRQSDLKNICAQARLWIHPHFEAFSLSALEATSYGLPVIIPEKSGVTELFKNGTHGFFPKKSDVKTLTHYIRILLSDKKLAQEMGQKAKSLSLNFTPEKRVQKLAAIINKILSLRKLTVLETAHVGKNGLAGGDILLEKMTPFIGNYQITVIGPKNGISHWENLKDSKIKYISSPLDNFSNVFLVLVNYFIRIIITFLKLSMGKTTLLYSSTDVLPDIVPAFFIKIINSKTQWIARVHHLLESPTTREGNKFVNMISYLLQQLSLNMIKRADVVIALNLNLKNQLQQSGFSQTKLEVLGGGIDLKEIQQAKIFKNKYEGVYLGRLHRTKGIFDLPQIWSEVVKAIPQAKLAIIGPGEKGINQSLKMQFKNMKIENNVEILGYLNQKQVYSILKSCKVFLFTDHEAGFGLAAAQSLAAGLPIVGYDIGILGTVFKKGYLKVPLSDKNEFAQKVIYLLQNATTRNKLSQDAQNEATNFVWSKIGKQFSQIINKLAITH